MRKQGIDVALKLPDDRIESIAIPVKCASGSVFEPISFDLFSFIFHLAIPPALISSDRTAILFSSASPEDGSNYGPVTN